MQDSCVAHLVGASVKSNKTVLWFNANHNTNFIDFATRDVLTRKQLDKLIGNDVVVEFTSSGLVKDLMLAK